MKINVYTDGACSGNPGLGGWGVIIEVDGKEVTELSGGSYGEITTNNRMELNGVIAGLDWITSNLLFNENTSIEITCDSKYVTDAFNKRWINSWKENKWKGGELKNMDLWIELSELVDSLLDKATITWTWIKGHNSHPQNERCDRLAVDAINL